MMWEEKLTAYAKEYKHPRVNTRSHLIREQLLNEVGALRQYDLLPLLGGIDLNRMAW